MEETVSAFVSETKKMHEAYEEHILRLEKQRQAAYDSLASLDFVCSNWSQETDVSALQHVRGNISKFVESVTGDLKSIESIKKEIMDRKSTIKNTMTSLLELYRELSDDDTCVISDANASTQFEQEIAETIFKTQSESLYYAADTNHSSSSS